jgi:hypothetical protein
VSYSIDAFLIGRLIHSPDDEICTLLDDVLSIGLAPTPNYQETYSILMWIIKVQRLPTPVLSAKKHEVLSVLKCALTENYHEGRPSILADGIKVAKLSE